MAAGRESFEIQVMRQGRWSTESVRDREAEARQLAKSLLADKNCAGARVVRNWLNRDGTMAETVIFTETRTVSDTGPARITPIDSAPPRCEKLRDYFGLESRMCINRILRRHLETVFLTPTELLHSFKEMQRIRDKDALIPSAVDAIATLQAKDTPQGARERREEIFAALDQIQFQARRAEGMKLPKLGGGRLSSLIETVAGFGGETPEYLAMVVLARELIGIRDWVGKLDRLCKMAAQETDSQATLLLDAVIADLMGANVVQEILGWQPSLGSAIVSMLDLADGKFEMEKSELKETTALLNQLFAFNRLPASRYCLIDRALRQLRSSNPLSRNDPAKEMAEYQRVLARLLVPGGLLSGPGTAEALTLRGTRFVEEGGATGRRAAISVTVNALPDTAHGVMYLSELTRTDFAKDHLDDIVRHLDKLFGARVIDELCRRSLSPKERMITATGAHKAAVNSLLPDPVKQQVAEHIDVVLERYLIDENIIERLDSPDSPLRDRAVRLVKFCGAGVLPPDGKALARARQRIVTLLRQPNFDAHFVQGIDDPVRAEKALRDFHALLVKAGFG